VESNQAKAMKPKYKVVRILYDYKRLLTQ